MAYMNSDPFTQKQLDNLRSKFNLLSRDGRTIRLDDALIAIRAVGQNPSFKDFNQALSEAQLDAPSRNYINFDEFVLLAWHVWDDETRPEDLIQAFRKFDRDGNGYLDTVEFRNIMTSYGERLNPNELDDIMKLIDVNHDGRISYSEFVRTLMQ